MGVKTIFKALIGTILIMVFGVLIVEMVNVSTTSNQMARALDISAYQALVSFNQSNYDKANQNNIRDVDGSLYISGSFYDTSQNTYNQIYKSNHFKDWLKGVNGQGNGGINEIDTSSTNYQWKNLRLLRIGLEANGVAPVYGASNYTDVINGIAMVEGETTPANIGLPYVGLKRNGDIAKDIVEQMIKWNTTQALSNYNSRNIVRDESNKQYVQFNGWRVYTSEIEITSISYKVFDKENSSSAKKKEFKRLTGIDLDILKTNNVSTSRYICVAEVDYKMPVTYSGVTPLMDVYNFVANTSWSSDSDYTSASNPIGGAYQLDVRNVEGKAVYYNIN